jgi:hypothetical protein
MPHTTSFIPPSSSLVEIAPVLLLLLTCACYVQMKDDKVSNIDNAVSQEHARIEMDKESGAQTYLLSYLQSYVTPPFSSGISCTNRSCPVAEVLISCLSGAFFVSDGKAKASTNGTWYRWAYSFLSNSSVGYVITPY